MDFLRSTYRRFCLFIGDHYRACFAIALLIFAVYIGFKALCAFIILIAVLAFISKQVPDNDDDWWDTHKGIGS